MQQITLSKVIVGTVFLRFIAQLNVPYGFVASNWLTQFATTISSAALCVYIVRMAQMRGIGWGVMTASMFYATTMLFNSVLAQSISVGVCLTYFLPLIFCLALSYRPHITSGAIRLFLFFTFGVLAFQFIVQVSDRGLGFIWARENRAFLGSWFGHANTLSFFVGLLLIATFQSVFTWRNIYGMSFILILAIIAGGRSILLASTVLVLALYISNRFMQDRRFPLYALYLCLVVVIGLYTAAVHTQDWTETSITSGNSLKWRVIHWTYYIDDLSRYAKWLFGFGAGAHENVTLGVYDRFFEVHNDFLRIVYDLGFLGLGTYLCVDLYFMSKFMRATNTKLSANKVVALYMAKYFFMFFDNMVTNFTAIAAFYVIVYICSYYQDTEKGGNRSDFVSAKGSHNFQYRVGLS